MILIRKIDDKYGQDQDHNILIIVIDFRLARFDSLSLKKEIKLILDNRGMEYPSLWNSNLNTKRDKFRNARRRVRVC
ncbi:MAG: hypothetical protein WA667_20665, partial [Candidatus Nitrosopolaris sp.]